MVGFYRPHLSCSLLATLAILAGCDQDAGAGETTRPRPVKSVTAKAAQMELLHLPGIVQARVETDLAFRTLGRVVSRKVSVGELVRAGDIVAEIDPIALQLSVRSAEADLRNAEAQFENALLTQDRKRRLASTSTGSIADLDLADQMLKSAWAGVGKANASLDKAREQLGYAALTAEFDGVVTATWAEVGQTVTAGQPVLKLARLDQRDVVVDVPDAYFRSLRQGDRFDVALQLDNTLRTSGLLHEIGPQADAGTRTHRLKIAIDQAPEVFRLGSVVTAAPPDLLQGRPISVPATAVVKKDGADHVWVVDPATHAVSLKSVRLDTPSTDIRSVRILSGLKDGEEVVVAGVNELAEGQSVRTEQDNRP
ncbi:efflux RND transporter periplasmic adaptor subunit [Ensifer sp. T173]|uniref:Efflux RND transporter periplasmic adaptor subunit n=1 Tax=Ensifer canadensis TaxID=555315 RepID=A0AAW4FTU3_9HYPH|nr:efflux RND transporter periplasmic adaptor subunit [Ensifer canadensis]MBM3094710.1 efflux RND transporter periplasmic adaptor subunit [Ensifer canadensis]UBI79621.1 efflux RND transporter periplasmic adaptor subunit [Ensifer canadensis]